jgi:hypothetical protein
MSSLKSLIQFKLLAAQVQGVVDGIGYPLCGIGGVG